MKLKRLEEILDRFSRLKMLVVGDFFLDQYLVIDPSLKETSLETGLQAHQVIEVRNSPGACGTVTSNLAALGVQDVTALTIVGQDGNGYELTKELRKRNIDTRWIIESEQRCTPTYTKPMRRSPAGEQEMERLDIKNRIPTPSSLEEAVISNLSRAVEPVSAVIIGDQVEEEDCGVITKGVREHLCTLALSHPDKIFFADSRARIRLFRNVIVKPNDREAAEAVKDPSADPLSAVQSLYEQTQRPVFLTRGSRGMHVYDGERSGSFPAWPVCEPIDPVGAGDSATAAIVSALSAGATLWEAAEIGNLAASVTIRKLGTTGSASPEEIREALEAGAI